jgi:hypothetical protein
MVEIERWSAFYECVEELICATVESNEASSRAQREPVQIDTRAYARPFG